MTQRFEQTQPTESASQLGSVNWEHVSQTLNRPPEQQTKGEQRANGGPAEQAVEHETNPIDSANPKQPAVKVEGPKVGAAKTEQPAAKPAPQKLVDSRSLDVPRLNNLEGSGSNAIDIPPVSPFEDAMRGPNTASIDGPPSRYINEAPAKQPWSWNEVMGASILFPLGAAEVVRQRREYAREHAQFQEQNSIYGADSNSSFGEAELSQVQIRELARQFDDACNGGLTGLGTDKDTVINILSKIPRHQMKDFDQAYRDRNGGRIGVQDELLDELSDESLARARSLFTGRAANFDSSLNTHDFRPRFDELYSDREFSLGIAAPESLKHIYRDLSNIRERHASSETASERTLWNTMPADQRRRITADIVAGSPSARSTEYVNIENAIERKRHAAIERVNAEQQEYLKKLPANVRAEMANFEKNHRNLNLTNDLSVNKVR